MYWYLPFLFILGLCAGSFLNVVAERLARGENLTGRSRCESCGRVLEWTDLWPVVSWLIRKGRCRYCRQPLSAQYPLMEVATALIFSAGIYFLYPRGLTLNWLTLLNLIYWLYIFAVLEIIFLVDLKYGLVLDLIIIPAIAVGALANLLPFLGRSARLYWTLKHDAGLGRFLLQTDYFKTSLFYDGRQVAVNILSALVLAGLFFTIIKITRGRGMGSGDILLGLFIGLITGFPKVIVAVFLGFTFGAAASLTLVGLRKKRFGETVPLGPFLSIATLLTIFFGDKLWTWYLNLL